MHKEKIQIENSKRS